MHHHTAKNTLFLSKDHVQTSILRDYYFISAYCWGMIHLFWNENITSYFKLLQMDVFNALMCAVKPVFVLAFSIPKQQFCFTLSLCQ